MDLKKFNKLYSQTILSKLDKKLINLLKFCCQTYHVLEIPRLEPNTSNDNLLK